VTPHKLELRMGAGVSSARDTQRAAEQACAQCQEAIGEGNAADTAFLFFSAHHLERAPELAATVLKRLNVKALVGVSTVAAVGGVNELENSPGVSVLAAQMPGVTATVFDFEDLPAPPEEGDTDADQTVAVMAERMGATEDVRMVMVLIDPFSVPLVHMLPALNHARSHGNAKAPLFGGMASASNTAGGNVLVLNDRILQSGGVGISLRGNLHVDTVVSQGCRPFGPNMVVTKSKGNMIFELGGRSAVDVVQETVLTLGDNYSEMIGGGLFIGRVIDEYKGRFGRNDFLIRNVVGVDPARGAIAVADRVRVGQTIRLHCRDAVTAHEDLALLLDAQKLYDKPKGALLVTCNGRGRRMFAPTHTPADHDALAVARAFSQVPGGEFLSKPGKPFQPQLETPVPLAGFFANGEIGPVGDESFVHGHTACLALFRDA
jgi:small ligand-binding sensory domain FIST